MQVITLDNPLGLAGLAQLWKTETSGEFGILIDTRIHLERLGELMRDPNAVVFGLKTEEGEMVGYIGVCVFDNPVGPGLVAGEHFWFVHPNHRGMSTLRLLDAAMEWAKSRRCTHFIANASMLASSLHDRVCRLYEKKGMSHFETSYICELR